MKYKENECEFKIKDFEEMLFVVLFRFLRDLFLFFFVSKNIYMIFTI